MIILAVHKHEMKTIKFDNITSVQNLTDEIRAIFQSLPEFFCLKLKTEDGEIEIKSNYDLEHIRNISKSVIKINIYERQPLDDTHLSSNVSLLNDTKIVDNFSNFKDKRRPLEENQCVQCYGQIGDILFRCSVCPRLDLCENCEYDFDHVHPLIKIKEKEYRNLKVFVALKKELDRNKDKEVSESKIKMIEIEPRERKSMKLDENVLEKVELIKNFSEGEYLGKVQNSEDNQIKKKKELKPDEKLAEESVKEYYQNRWSYTQH